MTLTHQYLLYIRANGIDEATEESIHLTYWFLTRALHEHRQQGRNGEFEAFAMELLAFLQNHRDVYTTRP